MKRSLEYWCGQVKWITVLFFKLVYAMGFSSGTWMINAVRMIIFGAIISFHMFPNCLWYITSPSIIRHIQYRSSKKAKVEVLKTLLAATSSNGQGRNRPSRRSYGGHHRSFGPLCQSVSSRTNSNYLSANEYEDTSMSCDANAAESSGSGEISRSPVDKRIACDRIVQQLRKVKGQGRKEKSSRLFNSISCLFEGIDLTHEKDFAKIEAENEERRKEEAVISDDRKSNGSNGAAHSNETYSPMTNDDLVSSQDTMSANDNEELRLHSNNGRGQQAADGDENSNYDNEKLFNSGSSDDNPGDIVDLLTLAEEQFDEDDAKIHNRAFLDIFLPIPLHALVTLKSLSSANPKNKTKGAKKQKYERDEREDRRKFKIVVLFSGGAWIIGYYLWSGLLARFFAAAGYIAVVPDYRNFPQVEIPGMVDDFTDAISWVIKHADKYNGDISDITVIGHSAGAHVSMLMVLREAKRCREQKEYRLNHARSNHTSPKRKGSSGIYMCHEESIEIKGRRGLNNRSNSYNYTNTCQSTDDISIPSAADFYDRGVHNGTFVMDRSSLLHVNSDAVGPVRGGRLSASIRGGVSSDRRESTGVPSTNAHLSPPFFPPKFNPAKDIKCYVGVSGIYDLFGLLPYLHGRGLRDHVMWRMAGLTVEKLDSPTCTEAVKEEYLKAASPLWYFGSIIGKLGSAELSLGLPGTPSMPYTPESGIGSEPCGKRSANSSCMTANNNTSFTIEEDVAFLQSVIEQSSSRPSSSDRNTGMSDVHEAPATARDNAVLKGEDEIRSLISSLSDARVAEFLPRNIKFVHGVLDASAPLSESSKMTSCLRISAAVNSTIHRIEERLMYANGIDGVKDPIRLPRDETANDPAMIHTTQQAPVVQLVHIEGANHTDPILEELLCGKCYIIDLLDGRHGAPHQCLPDGNIVGATVSPDISAMSNLLKLKVPTTLSFGRRICPF